MDVAEWQEAGALLDCHDALWRSRKQGYACLRLKRDESDTRDACQGSTPPGLSYMHVVVVELLLVSGWLSLHMKNTVITSRYYVDFQQRVTEGTCIHM